LILHAVNFLAVPLAVLKDSPSYLQGAVYWMQHHTLDGVSSYRGPGTTLLFTPAMAPFGRNPIGLQLLLHLLTIGCAPISYRLGWQLGRRRWFAFSAGLLTALIPDLYVYSSYVLSEGPDVFVGLLFCTLLLTALQTSSFGWILATLLTGSFAVLVRSENAAVLLLGAGFLLAQWVWSRAGEPLNNGLPLWKLGLAVLAAVIPLLAWSAHNQRVYGFFGLSDFGGAALYDGWIYFGENSPVPITDHNSSAVRLIETVHPIAKPSQGDAPTAWTMYYALIDHGYGSEQAFALLQQATLDSIRRDPAQTLRLLLFKLRQGFEPHPFIPATFPLAGEQSAFETLNSGYFDPEPIFIPLFVNLQRRINDLVGRWYESVFTVWFWLGAVMLFICAYRRPFWAWFPLVVVAINVTLLPTIIGMSMWRYVLFGVVLMQYPLLAGAQSAGRFAAYWISLAQQNGFGFQSRSAS
jgi:hypothetical protein